MPGSFKKFLGLTSLFSCLCLASLAQALPPPEDIPEEVLRTEIITEARSPLDGTPLTAAQYAEVESALQADPQTLVSAKIRQQVFLLRIRRLFRTVIPL